MCSLIAPTNQEAVQEAVSSLFPGDQMQMMHTDLYDGNKNPLTTVDAESK